MGEADIFLFGDFGEISNISLDDVQKIEENVLRGGGQFKPMACLSLIEGEAMAAVNELPFAVDSLAISDTLPRTDELRYVNITTCEQDSYCLELIAHWWRIVSTRHGHLEEQLENKELVDRYFETVYQFPDVISPAYRQRFGNKLIAELYKLSGNKEHSSANETL